MAVFLVTYKVEKDLYHQCERSIENIFSASCKHMAPGIVFIEYGGHAPALLQEIKSNLAIPLEAIFLLPLGDEYAQFYRQQKGDLQTWLENAL